MIYDKQNKEAIFASLLSEKLTIILEQETTDKRKDILSFFQAINSFNFYAVMGRKNIMLPFLSVQDNLLLGIPKKEKENFLIQINQIIIKFKLNDKSLKQSANELSEYEQMIFQIIRALILKQNIIIFDTSSNQIDTSLFLFNLMPILKSFTKLNQSTAIIVTSNNDLANSNYYDQCILLDSLFK
ncbi:MAG: hypothetical protein RR554_01530 [Vagococcus sp.]|uniref:hypothetical protein n=1 Tax=Vagococcus sp. TaxID=1933889 RepID=UPI002FC90075